MATYSGIGRAGAAIGRGLADRRERKEKQKQDEKLIKGVEQMMEHPAVAKYFPEEFDPYEVGAQGTMAALNLVSQAMRAEQQEHETAMARMGREQAEEGIAEEDRFMQQLHQHARGVGEGVYRPEVRESYRDLLRESPMAAAAAETGVRPELLQRYGIGAPEEARGFSPEQMGVAREIPGVEGRYFVPTSGTAGQVIDTTEKATRGPMVQQLLQLKRQARMQGDTEAADLYDRALTNATTGRLPSATELLMYERAGIDVSHWKDVIERQGSGGGNPSPRQSQRQAPTTEAEAAEMRSPERTVDDFFRKEDWE